MTGLSVTMRRTLEAIQTAGGEAHPEIGGWWRTAPHGPRLKIQTDDWRGTAVVGTATMMALAGRGLLTKIDGAGNRNHSAYQLTAAGRAALCPTDPTGFA